MGDACSIARQPLVLTRAAWAEVTSLAEALAKETLAAEAELVQRPALAPRARAAMARSPRIAPRGVDRGVVRSRSARPLRFSFHDRRLAHLRSEHRRAWRIERGIGLSAARGAALCMGDVGRRSGGRVRQGACPHVDGRGTAALVHATAFSDDQQMMLFVAAHASGCGPDGASGEPDPICAGTAGVHRSRPSWWQGPLDLVVRFFPGRLARRCSRNQPGGRSFSPAPGLRSAIRRRRF